jgi:hypothetical protein
MKGKKGGAVGLAVVFSAFLELLKSGSPGDINTHGMELHLLPGPGSDDCDNDDDDEGMRWIIINGRCTTANEGWQVLGVF